MASRASLDFLEKRKNLLPPLERYLGKPGKIPFKKYSKTDWAYTTLFVFVFQIVLKNPGTINDCTCLRTHIQAPVSFRFKFVKFDELPRRQRHNLEPPLCKYQVRSSMTVRNGAITLSADGTVCCFG
jgi:hypothetical protein